MGLLVPCTHQWTVAVTIFKHSLVPYSVSTSGLFAFYSAAPVQGTTKQQTDNML